MELHCSFCGKAQRDVSSIVPSSLVQGVGICNECVMMGADLMIQRQRDLSTHNRELRKEVAALKAAGDSKQLRAQVKKELLDTVLNVLADEEGVTTSAGSEEVTQNDEKTD